jgi:H+/Cl- antiporter ClcA
MLSKDKSRKNYNTLATLFWNTEGSIIRSIINHRMKFEFGELLIFGGAWYIFTITTYGTNVPAGLFLPGMIIGCTMGNLLTLSMEEFDWIKETDP